MTTEETLDCPGRDLGGGGGGAGGRGGPSPSTDRSDAGGGEKDKRDSRLVGEKPLSPIGGGKVTA